MVIEVKKQATESVTVKLPYFCRTQHSSSYFKIVSDKKCIRVCPNGESPMVGIVDPSLAFELYPVEIPEDEFNAAYASTLTLLKL